ncbi:hypothetical protein [Leifsonia xyli]|uniref:hypothetical protein n=1 Tax=Leifsonia xyli TaxID=1575 RepID=UPI003D6688E2
MDGATRGERHSDDELASALEEEVARITPAIPIVVPRAGTAPAEAQAADGDDADEASDDEDQWVGAPTELISFDDLPVRREPTGPEPTFSPWVATAAIPVQRAEEPQPEPPAEVISPPAYRPIARAEPLDFVPPELAPRDSEPVPVLPVAQPESDEQQPEPRPDTPPAPAASRAVDSAPAPAALPEAPAPEAPVESASHAAARHARPSILTPRRRISSRRPSALAPAAPPGCSGCGSRAPRPSSASASARPCSSSA